VDTPRQRYVRFLRDTVADGRYWVDALTVVDAILDYVGPNGEKKRCTDEEAALLYDLLST
jgi:hypothetical protein